MTTIRNTKLIVGTYTKNKTEGIYVLELDASNGHLNLISKTNGVADPSFLCISKDKKFVYAVNESGKVLEDTVSAFHLDAHAGQLTFINTRSTKGTHPCFVSIDKAGKNLFVANYTSGNLSSYAINENGALASAIETIQHFGASINLERQGQAHVHATVLSEQEDYMFAADLGTDELISYSITYIESRMTLNKAFTVNVKPGSGPRHLTFNQAMTKAYLTLEMSGEIAIFNYKQGQFQLLQSVKLESEDFTGENSAADIHLSKDGRFLYASNRGDANSIIAFSVDEISGQLTLIARYAANGITPRNFAIDPSDQFLLVANQDSHSISVFEKSRETGKLKFMHSYTEIEYPVCLKFIDN